MCVYILSREILVVSKERNVINIHAMRNVVYVGFSKRQIMTKEIFFFLILLSLLFVTKTLIHGKDKLCEEL